MVKSLSKLKMRLRRARKSSWTHCRSMQLRNQTRCSCHSQSERKLQDLSTRRHAQPMVRELLLSCDIPAIGENSIKMLICAARLFRTEQAGESVVHVANFCCNWNTILEP